MAPDPALRRARPPAARYAVVIIGAGVNGAGLFRDLSLQGVDCLIADANDVCAGASAAPSRLIHGGIKYLETGEFRLVAQSTVERNLLLRNAPHYVKPIETVLPIPSWFGGIVPSIRKFFGRPAKLKDRGLLITQAGLALFDWFGRRHRVMPRHRIALTRRTRAGFPDMATSVVATATYYDARITHAERLGLELLLDGMTSNPRSLAVNHLALEGTEGGALLLRDGIGGALHRVEADVVVNAAGPWIDGVNASLGITTDYIGGNKGSHLLVDNPRLLAALHGRMVYFGAADGRMALLYPFMGLVLIGSTDIPVTDPDAVVCTPEERDYMLGAVREIFPGIPVTPEQVVYTYCGVRPLPRSEASDPGAVSRDHSIRTDRLPGSGAPVHSLIGGKWTTFRGFAAEAADLVLKDLGRPRLRSTELLPIGGGRDYPATEAERRRLLVSVEGAGATPARAETLVERYGTKAIEVAAFCTSRQDTPLAALPTYTRAELGHIMEIEMVGRLADVLFRRTDIALSGRLTPEVTRAAAVIGGEVLGWDAARQDDEVRRVRERATAFHGMGRTFASDAAA